MSSQTLTSTGSMRLPLAMKNKTKLIILISTLLLNACRLDVPKIASGDVAVFEQGHVVQSHVLSSAQVDAVSSWLRTNNSGWEHYIATPSAQVSAMLIATDKTPVGLYILGSTVIVNTHETQFSHSFSETELKLLRQALGVNG